MCGPEWRVLEWLEDCVLACDGMDFGVAKGRLVTQSCSLLSMAHTLTHHGWNTHHDQHAAAGGSQNKLLTIVSLWSDMGHATTVRWVEWSRMSSKVMQHAGELKLPQHFVWGIPPNPWNVHGQTRCQCQHLCSQKGSWTFYLLDMIKWEHSYKIFFQYKMLDRGELFVFHN